MNDADRQLCEHVCKAASKAGWGLREMKFPGGMIVFQFRQPDGRTTTGGLGYQNRQDALTSACRYALLHFGS